MAVLEHLEPGRVFHFFEQMSAIPRGSGNTKAVSDWCADFARARGLAGGVCQGEGPAVSAGCAEQHHHL